MHITALYAENVKRLRAVAIKPDGSPMIQITGENEQGKSSVLDSIFYALAGGDVLPTEPVRRGEEHATIRVDTEDYVIVRRFSADGGTTLQVRSKDGAKYPTPQTLLDTLIGSIAFDPLAFTRMKPVDQFDALRKLVNLGGLDIPGLHAANRDDYAKRTDVNRRAKALRAQAEGVAVAEGLPEQPVDVDALVEQLEQAGQTNMLAERMRAERQTLEAGVAGDRAEADKLEAGLEGQVDEINFLRDRAVEDLERQIADLQAKIAIKISDAGERVHGLRERIANEAAELRAAADEKQAKLEQAPALPEAVDAATIRARIDEGNRINAQIQQRARRLELEIQAETEEQAAQFLTKQMDDRTQTINHALAAAKMPVDGLSLGDGLVLFNGFPLDQAATAQRIRVSMGIAMAANPKLRVVIIREGSALDSKNLQMIAELAAKNDFQVFVERVDESGEVGIVMEDGAVKGVPLPESPEPAPRKRATTTKQDQAAVPAGTLV